MAIRNKDEEIIYEVTQKDKLYDCVLRNFFTDGSDYEIRQGCPLAGGLVHGSKDKILQDTFDETIFFWANALRKDSEKHEGEGKEYRLAVAEALETLDYNKIQKQYIRGKKL